jgi:hypothetical protein
MSYQLTRIGYVNLTLKIVNYSSFSVSPDKFVDCSCTFNSKCIRPSGHVRGQAAVQVHLTNLSHFVRIYYKCIILESTMVTLCTSCS